MTSTLLVVPPKQLEKKVLASLHKKQVKPVVFLSLNRPSSMVHKLFTKAKHSPFYIDCAVEKTEDPRTIVINAHNLDLILAAIDQFFSMLPQPVLYIDSITTLSLYNSERKTARFIEHVNALAVQYKADVFTFIEKGVDKELLDKVISFYDVVKKR